MDCPSCVGKLEIVQTEQGDVARCFVCGWSKPPGILAAIRSAATGKRAIFILFALIGIDAVFHLPTLAKHRSFSSQFERVQQPADYQWSVRTVDDQFLYLTQARGKVLFLNFWATWCLPCRMEMPGIQKLYDQLKNNPNIVFVCVSDESTATVSKFLKRTRYTFPVYVTNGPIPPVFSSPAIPTTFIISPQGRMVRYSGAVRWNRDQYVHQLQELARSSDTQ